MTQTVIHPFAPIYDENSRILILGSFPSVKSRENEFYYGNPQNRFWRVLAAVYGCKTPHSIAEKKDMLLLNGAALWDSAAQCSVEGSSDSSIKSAVPNDISIILNSCSIERIYANGQTAKKIYDRLILPKTERAIILLPSTSPANAAFSLERLINDWQKITE